MLSNIGVKDSRLSISFFSLIMICMFLGAMNFVNRYYVFVFLAFFLFVVTPGRKILFTPSLVILLLFSTSLLLFDVTSTISITNMMKPFTYPICYLMGYSLLRKKNKEDQHSSSERRFGLLFLIISLGVMLHFLLNMLINGIADSTRNELIDFWSREEMSATGQAPLSCLMIALLSAYLFSNAGKKKKIFSVCSLILIVGYNLILAGRTIFLLLGIALLLAALHYGWENKKFGKVFFSIAIITLVVVFAYTSNFLNVKTLIERSNFYLRFYGESGAQGINEDTRLAHKLAFLQRMGTHLFGGSHIRNEYGQYAHDLYLDTYDDAGIFALLTIAIYITFSLIRLAACVKNKRLSFNTRQLLLCLYVVVNIQFWMEPILRGMPWLLAVYCFLDGGMAYIYRKEKQTPRKHAF